MMRPLPSYKSILNEFQQTVLHECLERDFGGGISIPLGSGKTILSLFLGLEIQKKHNTLGPILIICPKTLLGNWEFEIRKFFFSEKGREDHQKKKDENVHDDGLLLPYQIVHSDILRKNGGSVVLRPETRVILTTGDVLRKSYKQNHIQNLFVQQVFIRQSGIYENVYLRPEPTPLLCPDQDSFRETIGEKVLLPFAFYSTKWSCLIVDEIQKFSNITTQVCKSVSAICAPSRWGLSGTLFEEPKIENMLGFCVLLNLPDEPRCYSAMSRRVFSDKSYRGLGRHIVMRKKNDAFVCPPKINEHLITHTLSPEEKVVYEMLKKTLLRIDRNAKAARQCRNDRDFRLFNSQRLSIYLYLRQALVCPMLPIASLVVNSLNSPNRDSLAQIILQELRQELQLGPWLEAPESVISSRMNKIANCVKGHPNELIVVYTCFASFLKLLEHYFCHDDGGIQGEERRRPVFRLSASMSFTKRMETLQSFEDSKNGLLLLTYELGAEGLNLQFAKTMICCDFWWNAAKVQQAIGRINRLGQKALEIDLYFFSSNTGIERIVFQKQQAKLKLIDEMKEGTLKTNIPRLCMNDVIRLISLEENTNLFRQVSFY